MIPRPAVISQIERALRIHPVAALLGPRQCGKTTLARMIAEQRPSTYFDLENPIDVRRLTAPMTTLQALAGLVIIDEVQRRPDLFELVRVLVDRPGSPAQFLLLGSASPHLVRGVSESLAGRIGFVDLSGFDLAEVGAIERDRLWLRGGFPRSFLAESEPDSAAWRQDFIRTFLERDIPQLGITIPAETLRRFWTMVAHFHGQVWNAAQFARSLGASEATARRYLDILAGAYMVRVLPPWFENVGKRQTKSPKIYIRDSGILHGLLQLTTLADLQSHPKLGLSWEGFAIEQVISGLPRSGSTLLCNILAQNQRIHATATSGILEMLFQVRNSWDTVAEFRAMDDRQSTAAKQRVLSAMLRGYFADVDRPIVFDKSRGWLGHLEMAEAILGYKPRVLVPVRDLRDVLASFERLYRQTSALSQTPDEAANYLAYQKLENRLDTWAGAGGPVGMAYNRIKDAQARGWGTQMHFVRYEMLTAKPAETMADVYRFLGEQPFQHDFEHVEQVTIEDDRIYGFANLHTIRPQVQPQPSSWPTVLGRFADKFAEQEVWQR